MAALKLIRSVFQGVHVAGAQPDFDQIEDRFWGVLFRRSAGEDDANERYCHAICSLFERVQAGDYEYWSDHELLSTLCNYSKRSPVACDWFKSNTTVPEQEEPHDESEDCELVASAIRAALKSKRPNPRNLLALHFSLWPIGSDAVCELLAIDFPEVDGVMRPLSRVLRKLNVTRWPYRHLTDRPVFTQAQARSALKLANDIYRRVVTESSKRRRYFAARDFDPELIVTDLPQSSDDALFAFMAALIDVRMYAKGTAAYFRAPNRSKSTIARLPLCDRGRSDKSSGNPIHSHGT